MSANLCGLFLCPYHKHIIPSMGVDFLVPSRALYCNGRAASIQGVEQRGAEPLLFPQSETFLIVQHYG